MTPFEIHVDDDVLADLQSRLRQTRLPDRIPGTGHTLGMDTGYLARIIDYWTSTFDWRRAERRLNSFDHHTVELDGTQLHYVHARSSRPGAMPLLMLHGWPSSFVQMLDIIPLLTRPAHGELAFDVVVVSLPGYGFSSIPTAMGSNFSTMGPLVHRLMTEALGYRNYGIRASDLGLGVANVAALTAPGAVLGIHTSGTNPTLPPEMPDDLSPEEEEFVVAARAWNTTEMAYLQLQASKPQTIGVAQNDSPAGLAAWIGEKFWRWTDNHGKIEDAIGLDGFLTNVTIYWVTQTITSSMRLYYEAFRDPAGWSAPQVPVGYLMAEHDMFPTPRSWVERQGPVAHWATTPKGGHFLEWEQPQTVADDLRSFFGRILDL